MGLRVMTYGKRAFLHLRELYDVVKGLEKRAK